MSVDSRRGFEEVIRTTLLLDGAGSLEMSPFLVKFVIVLRREFLNYD